jgi:hypothetical protein
MANNRVYIVCKKCLMEQNGDHSLYLAKYYPSQGWYSNGPKEEKLEKFFEEHSHEGTLFGYGEMGELGPEPFVLYFEAGRRDQDQILMKISESMNNKE